jgi:hypothetical protein
VTRGLSFSGLIRRAAPFSHLLRHTRGWRENPDTLFNVFGERPPTSRK